MATVLQYNSLEHSFIKTMLVAQLINKVSVFCGNELDLRKFGREDVNLIELVWIRRNHWTLLVTTKAALCSRRTMQLYVQSHVILFQFSHGRILFATVHCF
jgi:hypothetical protein